MGCQNKGGSPIPYGVKRVQGVSEGGAAFSAAKQVNEAYENIKSSLANLIEGVQVFNSLPSGPKLETAHVKNSGAFRRNEVLEGPVAGSKGVTNASKEGGAMAGSETGSSAPVPNPCSRSDGYEGHQEMTPLQENKSDIYPCRAIRSGSEGEGSSSGSSEPQSNGDIIWRKEGDEVGVVRRKSSVEEALAHTEVPTKTSPECRRLLELREHGAVAAQPKWRSNGGIGALHLGATSPSRLSRCSVAESVNDIIHCNNRLKIEENEADSVRIWDLGHNLGLQCPGMRKALLES